MTHIMRRSKHTIALASLVFLAGNAWTQKEEQNEA
jgi:hypothetical protein